MTTKSRPPHVAAHAVMLLLSFIALFPVYWMFQTSFRASNEIFSSALWPNAPTLDNYRAVLATMPILGILQNTFLMAATTTLAQVVTGLLAAWALVRWTFPGGRIAHTLIALSWLVPFQVVMIPNYVLATKMGLLDSIAGLVIPNAAAAFTMLVIYNAMRGFPRAVIEAARMDGAGSLRTLMGVVAPNIRAPLASVSILCFISAWNDYFWPLLLIRRVENSVVQIGLQFFMTQEGNDWGLLMAAATLASLPILLIYLVLQRQVVDSFIKSGVR
ncbi:carbohydrate ABC transporter permease [Chelativorans sp. Marseille-P2723]|uniref:carbohydrate ABC transporter permease n=1 Tax=Chelativorans sp. Marseille-P2723 TaxID=2709133 RepID=UPI00156FE588|nr:carbohydrate ABC transporter permease [Chelativorans sp. Marseille-P2723]